MPGLLCFLRETTSANRSRLDLVKAGCLRIEEEIVDATTEEGKRYLKEMEEIDDDAARTDGEPLSSEKKAPAETARDA